MSSNYGVSVADLNTDFLPLIYDIIRSVERESNESTPQRSVNIREQHLDCNTKIQQLRDRLNECRQQISKIDGIGSPKEEQLKNLDALKQQLIMKKELLMKYKHSCPFDSSQKI